MTLNDLYNYFDDLGRNIETIGPEIVAETAVTYYKESFTKKGFGRQPWEPARVEKNTGSLMVESGALLNSIEPVLITPKLVTIQAGNEKVNYAQIHNEGFKGVISIPAHTRNTKHGAVKVSEHTREIDLPQRQYMGETAELKLKIKLRLEAFIKSIT